MCDQAAGRGPWGWPVMRPDQYSRWIDPAPLEVERPRLPWWTMAPRKLLWAASPIIAVVVLVMVEVFLIRRMWRYPLFLIGAVILAGLGVGCSWWVPVGLLAVLGVGCGLWAWQHRDSFERTVIRQVRSEWRCALVYAWRWRRVMLFSELTKRTGAGLHRVHYPTIRRVRADMMARPSLGQVAAWAVRCDLRRHADLDHIPARHVLSYADVAAMIDELGDVGRALDRADPAGLEDLYSALRLEMVYDASAKTVNVTIRPAGRGSARVRGGT